MTLEQALVKWQDDMEQKRSFQPNSWYARAQEIVSEAKPTEDDLLNVCRIIGKKFYRQAIEFVNFGVFVSAIANHLSKKGKVITVPIYKIDDIIQEKEPEGYVETFEKVIHLSYLGFKHAKGTVIYQGNAGYAFGAEISSGKLVLTKSAGQRAGWKQSGGLTVILGDAGNECNELQTGGTTLIAGKAGDNICKLKKAGKTYVMDSIGNYGGRDMEGGELLIVKNAGDFYAYCMKGNAKIKIGGAAGKYRADGRLGGQITVGQPVISEDMTKLYTTAIRTISEAGKAD